eukprot:TRINITY_DN1326_c0_g1_i2.p1 TRINITY_DN1326_c0_g1~~TRINITY_DN1326_c0_g1_i2.p1  ORF type:complete len:122 (-),score=43.91 TRINITY_DN1326_c0_g1_i2:72-392(-)
MSNSNKLVIEETLGVRATKIAQEKAAQWLDDTWNVIQKRVLDTATRGLFHCTIHFEDLVPQDPENQRRLLKILQQQNLKGEFETIALNPEASGKTSLKISWGNDHF